MGAIKQKFKKGDKVRIVQFGHLYWMSKQVWHELQAMDVEFGAKPLSKPSNLYKEVEDMYILDMNPDIVGKEGIIVGSYADQYAPNSKNKNDYRNYSVSDIPTK